MKVSELIEILKKADPNQRIKLLDTERVYYDLTIKMDGNCCECSDRMVEISGK